MRPRLSRLVWFSLGISEIPRSDGRTIDLVFARSGNRVNNLPWHELQFTPGTVHLPAWLVKKRSDLQRELHPEKGTA